MLESDKGRKEHQKMKPYLVYQYLLRNSDENHVVTAPRIVGYLLELGIYAERRSIYKDIEEINNALWLLDNKDDIEVLGDEGLTEILDEAKENGDYYETIVYDNSKKGFYVFQRKYNASDIRLILISKELKMNMEQMFILSALMIVKDGRVILLQKFLRALWLLSCVENWK